MNSPKSVAYGWVVFAVAGLGGSYIGYKQWKSGVEERAQVHAKRAAAQQEEVKRINEKLARERRDAKAGPSPPATKPDPSRPAGAG
jgi:hypothetical protein